MLTKSALFHCRLLGLKLHKYKRHFNSFRDFNLSDLFVPFSIYDIAKSSTMELIDRSVRGEGGGWFNDDIKKSHKA